jgi:hypothetical protein
VRHDKHLVSESTLDGFVWRFDDEAYQRDLRKMTDSELIDEGLHEISLSARTSQVCFPSVQRLSGTATQDYGLIFALVSRTGVLQCGEQVIGTGGHWLGLVKDDGLGAHLFAV